MKIINQEKLLRALRNGDASTVGQRAAADALEHMQAEIDILREGLCNIAKTAIKASDSTFEHMAVDILREANESKSQSVEDSNSWQ